MNKLVEIPNEHYTMNHRSRVNDHEETSDNLIAIVREKWSSTEWRSRSLRTHGLMQIEWSVLVLRGTKFIGRGVWIFVTHFRATKRRISMEIIRLVRTKTFSRRPKSAARYFSRNKYAEWYFGRIRKLLIIYRVAVIAYSGDNVENWLT